MKKKIEKRYRTWTYFTSRILLQK